VNMPLIKGAGDNVKVLGLNAISTLLHLEPNVDVELEKLILVNTAEFLCIVPGEKTAKADKKAKKGKVEEVVVAQPEGESQAKIVNTIQTNLADVFSSILFMDVSVECLRRMFNILETYSMATESIIRDRTCSIVLTLLKKYVEYKTQQVNEDDEEEEEEEEEEGGEEDEKKKKEKEKEKEEKRKKRKNEILFSNIGFYLAMIIPRCTDPSGEELRQRAIETIGLLLYVDHVLRSGEKVEGDDEDAPPRYNFTPPEILRPINALRDRIKHNDINKQYGVVQELSSIISEMISPDELLIFLKRIMTSLLDVELFGACGACVMLNGTIKQRGEELQSKVSEVVHDLIQAMQKIKSDQTMNATLHAVRNLGLHHRIIVIDTLLDTPVPHSVEVIKSFQVIAKDDALVGDLVDHLTNLVNNQLLMEEKGKGKFVPRKIPMSATCAIGEILETKELQKIVQERYAVFAATVLLRFGTTNGMAEASKQTVETFKKWMSCAKEDDMKNMMEMEDRWKRLEAPEYVRVITDITAELAKSHPVEKENMYKFLLPYMKGNYPGQRVVASTVIAELVNHTKDSMLLQMLLNCLMMNLNDALIRLPCLIGLGNIASAGKEEVDRYATTVLGALLATVDGEDQVLAMESMNGLSKIFEVVDESQVAPSLINLCLRIKPAFEKENDEMRASAFVLFGTMSRFGTHMMAKDVFLEQIHTSFPAVLMHLNDINPKVSEACKRALRRFAPLLRDAAVEKYLTSDVTEEGSSFEYDEFLDQIARLVIAAFPDRINFYVMTTIDYFKSNWTNLRGNATTLVGYVLHHLPMDRRKFLNVPMITQHLITLLNEKDFDVRRRCAASMGLLYEY